MPLAANDTMHTNNTWSYSINQFSEHTSIAQSIWSLGTFYLDRRTKTLLCFAVPPQILTQKNCSPEEIPTNCSPDLKFVLFLIKILFFFYYYKQRLFFLSFLRLRYFPVKKRKHKSCSKPETLIFFRSSEERCTNCLAGQQEPETKRWLKVGNANRLFPSCRIPTFGSYLNPPQPSKNEAENIKSEQRSDPHSSMPSGS